MLEATDIVRVVGDHLMLKAKGREFVGLCPFHADHNPSMYVVPAKQIFHCFVCGAGGNAIDFVTRYHGMGFREALQFLAERAGIELELYRPPPRLVGSGEDREPCSRDELIEANAHALRFFRGVLIHAEHGQAARDVIESRGISREMVEKFGLGAAPDRWDGLVQYVRSKSLDLKPFVEAGLVKKRPESDGHYDALRHRLIFPIFDQIGRAVAFGGRKIREDDEPKYLNSPETPVFDKGATLFGLKQAWTGIQTTRSAIVTEGYTDVIACHQAGFTNVVATLGTALTPKHAARLERSCRTFIFLFDGDEAGQRAADRAFEVAFQLYVSGAEIDVRIAVMEGGKDPDELLKRPGGDALFRGVLDEAVDFMAFRFSRLRARLLADGFAPGSGGWASGVDGELTRLVELGAGKLSLVRRHALVRMLSGETGIPDSVLLQTLAQRSEVFARQRGVSSDASTPSSEYERVRREISSGRPVGPVSEKAFSGQAGTSPGGTAALEHALGCLLHEPNLAVEDPSRTHDVLEACAYASPPLAAIASALEGLRARGTSASLSDVLMELEDAEARSAATRLESETERRVDGRRDRVLEHWRACVARLVLERERATRPGEDATSRLERLRSTQERLGGNPLALPRPRAG
ncbi:MAG: DNA primase [Planctomycetota bacterium]|nr:DNA primase [Planctomycetota bacterium]